MRLLHKALSLSNNRTFRIVIFVGYKARHRIFWTIISPFIIIYTYLFFSIVVCSTYVIPSFSMYPTAISGDQIIVNKLILGGRLYNFFNLPDSLFRVIGRLPGFRKPLRNDLLVFNYPHKDSWEEIAFNNNVFYMKRCIALPGDTLSIDRYIYKVKGFKGDLGLVIQQQRQRFQSPKELREYGMYETIPYDSILNWNIQQFGPLYIPKKGGTIQMNRDNYVVYKMYIKYETKKKTYWTGQNVLLGDSIIANYTFQENYYFMAGDNSCNSLDSRFFGLIPEPFIAGKATVIWFNRDKTTGAFRPERSGIHL